MATISNSKPILCWVTERASLPAQAGLSRPAALEALIRDAVSAGMDWIQLREKDLETGPLADLARSAVEASRGTNTRILINDRLDVAWAVRAGGVHLRESSVPVAEAAKTAHRALGSEFLIGRSTHSQEGAQRAADEGADYVFFGPVFATPSKAAFGGPHGLAELERVCRAAPIPVVAIGGITAQTGPSCIRAGAAGIAAIRMFQEARDLGAVLASLRSS